MNFAIEVPGETNPLTTQNLYNTLQSASSPYQQQVQTGTKQLQAWEKEKGFYSLLQEIFLDQSLPLEIRYLAIIQLKNGIDKFWRKTAQNAVTKEEKNLIRSRVLDAGLNEANQRLALQNALVVAKIVRFEFPHDWPDVISSIVTVMRSAADDTSNSIRLHRTLLLLLHITKELSTARLQRSRASLQSVTPEVVFVLGRIYVSKVQKWREFIDNGGDDEGGALDDIDQSLLALKVLRRLLVSGYEFPHRNNDVRELWSVIKNQFSDLLGLTTRTESLSGDVRGLIERHLLQFSKLHIEMSKLHPASFALLPGSVELTQSYWGLVVRYGEEKLGTRPVSSKPFALQTDDMEEEEKPVLERLALKGFLLLRACIRLVFNPAQTFRLRRAEEKEEQNQSVNRIKQDLLQEDLIKQMVEILVTKYFVLTNSDLQEWESDPEEWERKEDAEGEGWEFLLRPCAERLFLDLVINFKSFLSEPLLNVFGTITSPENDDLIMKDSVYCALGLSAPVLESHVDFNSFLSSTLTREVQTSSPGARILRRRIAILVAQWLPVKVVRESRPLVYQIYQHLLNRSDEHNDLVVRLTAARQFKNIADDWEFHAKTFLPYASSIINAVMELIGEVHSTDTKMAMLNTVSVTVERMDHEISPYADRIVALLPPLWEQSGEEYLLKQAILTIMARLINAMKQESREYHALVLPLIKYVVQPGAESGVYLLEDALDLWAAIVSQTPQPARSDLIELAQYLTPIFEHGTENLRKALEITESYIILAPEAMLGDQLRKLFLNAFAPLLSNTKGGARAMVTRILELVIRQGERAGGEQALNMIAQDLCSSGTSVKLLEDIQATWTAHQTTGPNRQLPTLDGLAETDYINVLARLALGSTSTFLATIEASRRGQERDTGATMHWLLSEWFNNFENVGNPVNRKLHCLALTKLLESGEAWMLHHLQNLMTLWTDVLGELQEGAEDKGRDNLVYFDDSPRASTEPESPEDERNRKLLYQDAVHRINAFDFVRHHLQAAIARSGGQESFERDWLVHVDKDVVGGFGRLMNETIQVSVAAWT